MTALDAQMLGGAEERVAKSRWTNVELVQKDAAEIDYCHML